MRNLQFALHPVAALKHNTGRFAVQIFVQHASKNFTKKSNLAESGLYTIE